MSQVLNINADQFQKEVLESKVPTLVDFWAPWCRPCQMMGPILDEVARDLADKAKIVKVDVENPLNQELAMAFQIRSIPNMKVFKNGKVVEEYLGMLPKENLLEGLTKIAQS